MNPDVRGRVLSEAQRIEGLVTPPESVDQSSDQQVAERQERRVAWCRRIEDAVLDLANALPCGCEDYEARQLWLFLTLLRRTIEADPEVTDVDGKVALATIQMADVASRLLRRLEHTTLEDEREAADFVFEVLPNTDASTLSVLFGVSTKTVGSWRNGRPVRQGKDRVKLLAQTLFYLRNSMTETGLVMWFREPADLLSGRSPLDLLGTLEHDPGVWECLLGYARGGRAQLAG